jgi:hypothetical protein
VQVLEELQSLRALSERVNHFTNNTMSNTKDTIIELQVSEDPQSPKALLVRGTERKMQKEQCSKKNAKRTMLRDSLKE